MVTKAQIQTEDTLHGSYRFLINPSWDQFDVCFETYLYQRPEFVALSTGNEIISFGIARSDQPELLGFISFQLTGKRAYSGMGKPFGSLDYNECIDPDMLGSFLLFVEQQLTARGVGQVDIQLPALAYQPSTIEVWEKVLVNHGYYQVQFAVNHHLLVHATTLEKCMHSMEQRRLAKGKKLGLRVEMQSSDKLREIYHFIKDCREERGQSLSLSLEEMCGASTALPQSYLLFQATLNGTRIAATIVVRVNKKILYNFYPASALSYQSYSPQVILLEHIYRYGQEHDYEILDLGTSMVAGEPKTSLMNFKERVGGIQTIKLRLGKSLV